MKIYFSVIFYFYFHENPRFCDKFQALLEDLIFCWFWFGPCPEFSVADGLKPLDPKDCSKAGVDECLDLLQSSAVVLHVQLHTAGQVLQWC